jgi:hypothetical protein
MAVVTTAVIGVAVAGASAYQGFSNAAKQKTLAAEADTAAKKAMTEAKAKAETDYYEGLNVPMDAYEAEFENNLAVAQQNTEALQEGDARALAGGVGRVQASGQEGAEGTRIAMGEEISDLNKMKADSKEAINQQLIEMDVSAAKEQNMRKRDAEAARSASMQQGIEGVGGVMTGLASMAPLYGKSKADRRGGKIAEQYADQKPKGMSDRDWQAKMGDQNFSRKDYKSLKNAESGRARWNYKDERFDFQSDLGMDYMNSDY